MATQAVTTLAPFTQGEKLYLLVFRARKRKVSTKKVALGLGVHPEYLPYLYKQDRITMELIHKASAFFGVSPRLFDDDNSEDVKALMDELRIMRADLNEARQQLETAHRRIKRLEEDAVIRKAKEIKQARKSGETNDNLNHN